MAAVIQAMNRLHMTSFISHRATHASVKMSSLSMMPSPCQRRSIGHPVSMSSSLHGYFGSRCTHNYTRSLGPEPSAVGVTDYEHERNAFQLQRPEFFNFASDVIDYWANIEQVSDVRHNKPAFWWVSDRGVDVRWTFQELRDKSKRVANMLTGPCRLLPGDRVLVILPKLPQWWLLNIACVRAGIVLLPATVQLTSADIKHRLQRSNAKCVITDSQTAEKVDQVIRECPSVEKKVTVEGMRLGWFMFEDLFLYASNEFQTVATRSTDPSMIFFTSGTTGHPKMVEHSHSSYGIAQKITARYFLDLVPTDILWNLSDPGWAKAAYSSVYAPWIAGSCVFIHSSPTFDPEQVMKTLEHYPITTLCCPPTAFRMMIQLNLKQYNVRHVRHCVAGGEALNAEVVERWLDGTGRLIREGYGQSETVVVCCTSRCLPVKLGSMGKATPGYDVSILNADGEEVGANVEGEIAVRCKPTRPLGLFTQYVNNPEKMALCFHGDFYLTGDLARKDEDGYFWFSSRNDDIIISAGYRIGPFEVESALLEHPAVAESAVVSSPDETRGEVVKAFIILTADHKERDKKELVEEIQNHCRRVTAPYKYPRKIEFVDFLPKTISGKIRRVALRNKEWNR